MQRDRLQDFEEEVLPGVVCGQRFVPVQNVGAYLPAGRFPLLASAFMTVGVADVAGVPGDRQLHPAVASTASRTRPFSTPPGCPGPRKVHPLGGVQALAAMAFGLLDSDPADMLVGAGNAFVAEAKRQLYGRVGIDVLAGPSEVAVLADDSADAEMVAADLLGQAEHGPTSPASLTTTSERLAREVLAEIDRQLAGLSTREIAGAAWRDYGSIYVAESPGDRGRGDGHPRARAPRGAGGGPRLVAGRAPQLRVAVPRSVVHGGVRRQGHVRAPTTCCPRSAAPATPAG